MGFLLTVPDCYTLFTVIFSFLETYFGINPLMWSTPRLPLSQLPEPLLTFDLYNDFINVGKEIQRLSEKDHVAETPGIVESIVVKLRELTSRLPMCNYKTVQHMTAHLNRYHTV